MRIAGIMLRNTMIDLMVRPSELEVCNQRLNNILSLRKTTGLNALAECFNAPGKAAEDYCLITALRF